MLLREAGPWAIAERQPEATYVADAHLSAGLAHRQFAY
jgi:hypothetical protein